MVIEHHVDVWKSADHIIEMGPGAGALEERLCSVEPLKNSVKQRGPQSLNHSCCQMMVYREY